MSNNLTVFADATINGGSYDKIRVYGSATVTGDVTAKSMKVFGAIEYKGICKIDALKLFGACEFQEYVEVGDLNIKGACEFNNDIKVDYLKIYGASEFKENLFRCKEVKVYGEAEAKRLEADAIYINGYVTCTEQMNGDKIEIATKAGSVIKEMVGTDIEVKPQTKWWMFQGGPRKKVEVETIEGDNVYLENAIVKVVRGNNITIGPNCEIDLIEYHEKCDIKDKSGVKQVEKY